MTDETTTSDLEREKANYLDPDASLLSTTTTLVVELTDELRHVRMAGQHWKARAIKAEGQLVDETARANDLQRRLNERLADESAARVNGAADKAKAEAKP